MSFFSAVSFSSTGKDLTSLEILHLEACGYVLYFFWYTDWCNWRWYWRVIFCRGCGDADKREAGGAVFANAPAASAVASAAAPVDGGDANQRSLLFSILQRKCFRQMS